LLRGNSHHAVDDLRSVWVIFDSHPFDIGKYELFFLSLSIMGALPPFSFNCGDTRGDTRGDTLSPHQGLIFLMNKNDVVLACCFLTPACTHFFLAEICILSGMRI
jgi:hypothetical protein